MLEKIRSWRRPVAEESPIESNTNTAVEERQIEPGVPGTSFVDLNAVNFGEVAVAYRWNIRAALFAIQDLYERDAYAMELVNSIVDFAVGDGMTVDFEDERLNRAFQNWSWAATAPNADIWELQRFAALTLIRDGDIMFEKSEAEEGIGLRLYPLEARYVFNSSTPRYKTQAGVQVDDDLTPLYIHYEPIAQPIGSLNPNQARSIPAHKVLHTFKFEWANQARGLSWLRRSYDPIRSLKDYDQLIIEGSDRMIRTRGFLEVPNKYFTEEVAEEDDTAETKAARKLLQSVDKDDFRRTKVYPEGVTWHQQASTGITQEGVIRVSRRILVARAARGVGISEYLLSADFADTGVYASRQAYTLDLRFFTSVQKYLKRFMTDVVDEFIAYYQEHMPEWFVSWQGRYTINSSPFPFADPLRDAQALKVLLGMGMTTPQQLMRDRNINVKQNMDEIREWAKFIKENKDDYGVDVSKAFGSVSDDSDDMAEEKIDKMDI